MKKWTFTTKSTIGSIQICANVKRKLIVFGIDQELQCPIFMIIHIHKQFKSSERILG